MKILNDNEEFFKTNEGQKTIKSFKKELDKRIKESELGEKLLKESQKTISNIERTGSDILKNNS